MIYRCAGRGAFSYAVCLALCCFVAIACSHSSYPTSDHYDGKKFHNVDPAASVNKSVWQLLKWQFSGDKQAWPEAVEDNATPNFPGSLMHGEGSVTFINHATELIQFSNLTVITDPVFSDRASPFSWIGPRRHRQLGATLANMPKIDLVIVSHNHYDHLDLDSLVAIHTRDHPKFLVPLGNKRLLEEHGISNVEELDWWQQVKSDAGYAVTLVPMQHWSARGLFDRQEALWGGYVIEASGLKVLFAGDTGYNRQFKDIQQKFGSMDLSLLPIGAYEPRWFMQSQHMNPEEAVRAHVDLQSKFSVGMHFGTFQLTDEGIEDPVMDLAKSLDAANIEAKDFVAPKNGQTLAFPSRVD